MQMYRVVGILEAGEGERKLLLQREEPVKKSFSVMEALSDLSTFMKTVEEKAKRDSQPDKITITIDEMKAKGIDIGSVVSIDINVINQTE